MQLQELINNLVNITGNQEYKHIFDLYQLMHNSVSFSASNKHFSLDEISLRINIPYDSYIELDVINIMPDDVRIKYSRHYINTDIDEHAVSEELVQIIN